jgi:hypothetical protein
VNFGLGREATERALADPEGFGLGIDLGPGHEFDVDMDCEALFHAGPSAVNALSGEYPSRANAHPKVPAGEPWEENDASLRARFPLLMAKRPAP